MFRFLVNCFAVIGFFIVALLVWGMVTAFHEQKSLVPEPQNVVLTIDFTQPIVEQNESSPISFAMEDEPVVLLDLLTAIDHAAKDPHVKGIAAKFGVHQPSMVHAQEIRDAIAKFRESGKFTYAYGTDFGEFGLGNRAYYLASAFENIWLQPVGSVSLTGVGLMSPFAKGALDKIGVTADYMQREEYKSFMEIGQREDFSPPVKAEMQAMVDNLSTQIALGIASSRKWDIDHVKDLMTRGPYTDEEAVQEGLVTKLAYADEFDAEMERKAGKDYEEVDPLAYMAYPINKGDPSKETQVALIVGAGLIMEKAFDGGGFGEAIMGADTIAEAFNDAARNDDVRAILFRVDSAGGSPAASETIRRAMIHAQSKGKPVIVSMGETAASGGYWISMNGDRIIADNATLTGSIGVVAGKFAADGLLQKLGITTDSISTSPNAGMWNAYAPFSPEQRARVNALLDATYKTFVGNVSQARKIPLEKMPDIAKGRVFTGEQALKAGLVDAVGGYDVALKEIRQALKLDDKAFLTVELYPVPPSPVERILKFLKKFGAEGEAALSLASKMGRINAFLGTYVDFASFTAPPVSARMQLERVQ
ncbi:MAG: signal peptide peptidase SppA [Alphaproteobacteria bacterium]|nr:signal peptide peptidase SppA [Alphaproteobacteria bacterium]